MTIPSLTDLRGRLGRCFVTGGGGFLGTEIVRQLREAGCEVTSGSRRRYLKDKPERKRVENYESSNDAYVVEDFGAGCLVENIVFGDWSAA